MGEIAHLGANLDTFFLKASCWVRYIELAPSSEERNLTKLRVHPYDYRS